MRNSKQIIESLTIADNTYSANLEELNRKLQESYLNAVSGNAFFVKFSFCDLFGLPSQVTQERESSHFIGRTILQDRNVAKEKYLLVKEEGTIVSYIKKRNRLIGTRYGGITTDIDVRSVKEVNIREVVDNMLSIFDPSKTLYKVYSVAKGNFVYQQCYPGIFRKVEMSSFCKVDIEDVRKELYKFLG